MAVCKILVVVLLKNRSKNMADLNSIQLPPTLTGNSLLTSGPLASYREANKIPFRGLSLAARYQNQRACINILLTFTTMTT